MKRRSSGFRDTIHRAAELGREQKRRKSVTELDTIPGRCKARLRQIKEIHARRRFNGGRWVNWQMGQILAGGTEDLR